MSVTGVLHGGFVHPRRVRVLAAHAARLIPPGAHVLDVGTGDGRIAATVSQLRPDLRIEGLDVLVRPEAAIPVRGFDGRTIPLAAKSVDVVTFFDVLHHADEPAALLGEGARVARSCVVLKDHVSNGRVAHAILSLMDTVGNSRHGVASPNHYFSSHQWSEAIVRSGLSRAVWTIGGLGIYPWPLDLVFGRQLHVLARLDTRAA
jgi:SAM-dependent methyltransferase